MTISRFALRGRVSTILVIAGLLLAACSSAAAPAQPPILTQVPAAPTSTQVPMAQPTAAPTAVTLSGEITLWYAYASSLSEEKALTDALAQLKKDNPSLKVNAMQLPFVTVFDDWTNQVAAGKGPDMYTVPNDSLGDQVRAGVVAPIDSLMKDHLKDFSQAGIDGMTVEGKLYGVPGIIKAVALYYNKSTIPNPPKTTDELLALLKSGKKIALYEDNYSNFGWLVSAFSGKLMDDTGKCVADQDSGMADALKFLKLLRAAGAEFNSSDPDSDFLQGKVDMIINGPWVLGDYKKALGDKFGVVPMPAGPKGPATPLSGIDGWYINPKITPAQQQLAVDVGVYLFGPKGAGFWANEAGDPMVANGVISDDPRVQAFADAAAAGIPRPQTKEFSNWWGPFGNAVSAVVDGAATLIVAVKNACAAMNRANGK
jgi:arabinogalactan oligomer/maltooligosaccharide transport system substrate-binding protein